MLKERPLLSAEEREFLEDLEAIRGFWWDEPTIETRVIGWSEAGYPVFEEAKNGNV